MTTWNLNDERKKMQRTINLRAKAANLLLNTLRMPKPNSDGKEAKLGNQAIRRLKRLSVAVEEADKVNKYIEELDRITEGYQIAYNREVSEGVKTEKEIEAIAAKVNASAYVLQKEHDAKYGQVVLEIKIDEGDFQDARKDWESREVTGLNREAESLWDEITEALTPVKEIEAK